jgi:metallophosphoesterase superfamily enzyme
MNCADADFVYGVKSHIEAELDKLTKMEQALAIICNGDLPESVRQEHADYCEFLKNFYLEV